VKKRVACATVASFLNVASVQAGEVVFTCSITGVSDGFNILAVNPDPVPKTCNATCTVTKSDGQTEPFSYKSLNVSVGNQRFWFAGESGVKGAPLSNPKISETSCTDRVPPR
jgi:hypothetical protein